MHNKNNAKKRIGKTWEEIFGIEKAKNMRIICSEKIKQKHKDNVGWKGKFKKGHKINYGKKRGPMKEEFKLKISKTLKGKKLFGDKHPTWKGGKYKSWNGYWNIHYPKHPCASSGYIKEHRLIMEKKLNRYLNKNEHVHHIDYNKTNNKINNLIVLSNSEHMKLVGNLYSLFPELIKDGIIKFDKRKKRYYYEK